MNIVDNFEKIRNLLKFENEIDDFYFIQIIQRRKENPGMRKDSKYIKSYLIKT